MANISVLEALRGINAYPIPMQTIETIACSRGLVLNAEITSDILNGKAYNLARADVLLWLSTAPDISQGGQSYNFDDTQRTQFRNRAARLVEKYGEGEQVPDVVYGYKGSRL